MPELAIRYIRDSNPAWMREDLGPLEDLTRDIKTNGIKRPILVTPDYLVVDGARRVEVAAHLGLRTVPVHTMHTWLDVLEHLRPSHVDSYPMTWPELVQFWTVILKPIHKEQQYRDMTVTKKNGSEGYKPTYSGFVNDLSIIYDVPPSTIKTLRDYVTRLKALETKFPRYVQAVHDSMPRGEQARELAKSRVLKAITERLQAGTLNEETAAALYRQRIVYPPRTGSGTQFRAPREKITVDAAAPPKDAKAVEVLAEQLERIAAMAQEFRNFDIPLAEAVKLNGAIAGAQTEIRSMCRRMVTSSTRGEGKSSEHFQE